MPTVDPNREHRQRSTLGVGGTQQFTVTYKLDGKIVEETRLHDPFVTATMGVRLSWWKCLLGVFRGGSPVSEVQISVRGTKAAQRRILALDPVEMQRENEWEAEQRAERPMCNYPNDQTTGGYR
jgi:hypothetical protein